MEQNVQEKKKSSRTGRIVLGIILLLIGVAALVVGLLPGMQSDEEDLKESAEAFDYEDSEGAMRYIDMVMLTDSFASQKSDQGTQEYYAAFGEDGNVYLVAMGAGEYKNHKDLYDYFLNGDENDELPEADRTYGYPQKIDNKVRQQAIEYLNQLFGEEVLTEDTFAEYLGDYYLDTDPRPEELSGPAVVCIISGIVLIVIGILVMILRKKGSQDTVQSRGLLDSVLDDAQVSENGYKAPVLEETSLSYGPGILGAVVGSLAGAVIWVIMYQFDYLVGIAGYLSVTCAILCFKKFAGGINRGAIVLCTVISILILCGANVLACALYIVRVANESMPGVFSLGYVLSNFASMMDNAEAWPSFFRDLALGLVLALLATAGPLKRAMGKSGR